tara:strand:+ start:6583 stop:7389 length:807 start_codon:yes stop_codon:yes gene_type:complete
MYLSNKPKKSLGQNFLIDNNIIKKIVEIGKITEEKTVLEIGPGYGNLTKEIKKNKPKKIFAVEKDKKISLTLKNNFKNYENIQVINDDIFNIIENNNFKKNVVVFGNLPYNISTQILASLLLFKKWPPWYEVLILMFQKEVADRILAKQNSKEYGRLSVLCNWRMEVNKHFDISNNCFFPKPKISSTVLSFKPKKNFKFNLKQPKNLEKITRIIFSNRRKMINKAFCKLFKNYLDVAKELNINLNLRPGELKEETFYKIADKYEKLYN